MPILHRLACFRDDVVFLIFLHQVRFLLSQQRNWNAHSNFQRWIYRVDPKRVNEYGQVLVDDGDAADGEPKETESKKDK